MTVLKHPFPHQCYDIDELLKDTVKVSTYMRKLKQSADKNFATIDPNTYYGSGFECLFESILLQFSSLRFFGVEDYEPIIQDDYGVDFIGTTPEGEKIAYQCKARTDGSYLLEAHRDHLASFGTRAQRMGASQMVIVTTAKGVNHHVEKMFSAFSPEQKPLKVLGNSVLMNLLNNNSLFWKRYYTQLKDTKTSP